VLKAPPKQTHPIDLEDTDEEPPSPGQHLQQTPRREPSQDSDDDGDEEAEEEAMQLAQNRSHGRRTLSEAYDIEGMHEYQYESCEVSYDAEYLDALVAAWSRSYKTRDPDGNLIWVKMFSKDDSVKVTQWNYDCVKSVYTRSKTYQRWRKSVDRGAIDVVQLLTGRQMQPSSSFMRRI
jgi:hypothetical protein